MVQRGPSAGSRFLLDADLVGAGRHPDSEIFLDDVTVSRRHAEFRRSGNDVHRQRRRAASTAPTSTATASTRCELTDGDEVQIGKYRLVFFSGAAGS